MIAFRSTRGEDEVDLATALVAGIAPDGGLFVPTKIPYLGEAWFDDCDAPAQVAESLLRPFFAGSALERHLPAICAETFSFPLPLKQLESAAGPFSVLELFHGPTAAFKDIGARFLASSLGRLRTDDDPDTRPLLILVATSGDTGGAVAAAFHRRPGFEVGVLFPLGRVSARQQHQLTCWGDNVTSIGVNGSFDDCQRMVKSAFADPELAAQFRFSSANSINIGRLLPQAVYYASSSLEHWRRTGRTLSFIVPTGNLGNGLACVLARSLGLPIGDIVYATNANRTVPDYLASGDFEERDSIATLASAMDVGNPSNLERLRNLFGEARELRGMVTAQSVDDRQIEQQISADFERYGFAWCPHTATAMHVLDTLQPDVRAAADWAIVATAHPAKFDSVIEPLVGRTLDMPPALSDLLDRPASFLEMEPTLAALAAGLQHRERG